MLGLTRAGPVDGFQDVETQADRIGGDNSSSGVHRLPGYSTAGLRRVSSERHSPASGRIGLSDQLSEQARLI